MTAERQQRTARKENEQKKETEENLRTPNNESLKVEIMELWHTGTL